MTKAQRLLEALKSGPMKLSEAYSMTQSKTMGVLRRSGAIEEFVDENPDYALGKPGQRPLCGWVRLGAKEYPKWGRRKGDVSPRTLARAVELLERHGYKVAPPPAAQGGRT